MYQEFPTVLQDMDSLPGWKFIDVEKVVEHSRFMHLAVLARREGLLSVLPFILYQCCVQYSTAELLWGIRSNDHATIILAPEDQLACLAANPAIIEAQAETTFHWLYAEGNVCSWCDNAECDQARRNVLSGQFSPLPDLLGLGEWSEAYSEKMCMFCLETAKDKHSKGRERFWVLLPSLFDLPAWSELETEREDI